MRYARPPPGRRGCLPSQIRSHRLLPGGSATCPGETGRSKDTCDIVGNALLLVTNDSIEPARSSLWPMRLATYWGAAITSVSTATARLGRPRPGRSRNSRGGGPASRDRLPGHGGAGLSRGGEVGPAGERGGRDLAGPYGVRRWGLGTSATNRGKSGRSALPEPPIPRSPSR